ncbi:MAG: chromosome segregation protein SMC [Ruminococcaceae bacterium]|nr:chromosome segregation protein SMC [Oscillospiraceae bacterium]
MRLKSLELHGFKSFPEKTVITFDAGTTVIVGPNGSGKSNITDAMRWVLGELSTKNIRGSKMEDVIFVGADGYRPMGFAEVSVTFDNTDPATRVDSPYDEITVTRRYYRAGESEYFINRKAVRLRDIHELFMNTGVGREGYSIIGQGRIAEIVSKKSDERRGIFDETAGIAKYRFKKQEAQRKLDATEANMLRVADILSELESRVGPLERQSRKAREYLELFAQKKEVDVALWLYDMQRMIRDEEKTKADCALSRHELEMTQDTESRLQTQSDRLFDTSQGNKLEAERLYERIRSLTDQIHASENTYKLLENDAAHKDAEIASADSEAARLREKIAECEAASGTQNEACRTLENTLREAREIGEQLQTERQQLQKEYSEKEQYLDAELTEQKKHEEALLDLKVRLNVLRNTLSSQSERSGSIGADMEKYRTELAKILADTETLEESVREYTDAIAASDKLIQKNNEADAAFRARQTELEGKISSEGAKSEALQSRISAMQSMLDHFEGYNSSVRFVMNEAQKGKLQGIHGPVSHLISVKPTYTVALETAFGAALQNIVVDDESAAKSAIYALKNAGAGRATFYPLSAVKAAPRSREVEAAAGYPGFIGFADTLVGFDPRYAGVIGSILNRIAVFDNLDHATVMARAQNWRVRAVTLDGQQINAGGSFTGGSSRRDGGILSRSAQIDQLIQQKSALDSALAQLRSQLHDLQAQRSSAEGEIAAEAEKKNLLAALLRADQSQLDELSARRGVIENLLAQLSEDWEKLKQLGERGEDDIRAVTEQCDAESAEIARITADRTAVDIQRNELDDRLQEMTEKIASQQIRVAEIRKDLEIAQKAVLDSGLEIESLRSQLEEAVSRHDSLTESLAQMRTDIAEKRAEADARSTTLRELEKQRISLENDGTEYERRLNDLRLQLKDISAKKELLVSANEKNENRHTQLCADIDKMTQRLWDEYELTPSAAAELNFPPVEEGSRAPAAARLAELKGQIKALGHVNVAAIEEYTEVKERYDFVRVQMEDLNASKADLMDIIGSIEGEMEKMFLDSFEKINRNFGEVFRDLFGGGEAHLSLSDPENVLSSGIEISAAPPGKMIKNLSLLSGGEQAVIAIALLFALVRVNPSPFCIFDEIEAALDEVNVQRVAHYVQRVAQSMQIIMITHRRGTMEVADSLYGVTMPRRGVSKVFQLDMSSMSDEDFEKAL